MHAVELVGTSADHAYSGVSWNKCRPRNEWYVFLLAFTNGVSVKEENRGPQDGSEHSVVENSGCIDTHKVEGQGSDETQNQSKEGHSRVDVDPLIGGQGTSGDIARTCTT